MPVFPRPPVDGRAAHTARVWTVPVRWPGASAHRLPATEPSGPDSPLRGLPFYEMGHAQPSVVVQPAKIEPVGR